MDRDEKYMSEAIKIMVRGVKKGQSPFGAVIVGPDGKIISRAHNTVLGSSDATAHAEVNAIRKACKKLGSVHLEGCTIYSTCEPCPMCLAAIHWAGIPRVVFGATISDADRTGFREIHLPDKKFVEITNMNIELKGGVLRSQVQEIMFSWKGQRY